MVFSRGVPRTDRPALIKRCYSLPQAQDTQVTERARRLGISEPELVRRALDEYFERHPSPGSAEPVRRTR